MENQEWEYVNLDEVACLENPRMCKACNGAGFLDSDSGPCRCPDCFEGYYLDPEEFCGTEV